MLGGGLLVREESAMTTMHPGEERMSLPVTTTGYALGPDDGEAIWFGGGIGLLRATGEQTEGRYTAYELRVPRGFGPPQHTHADEDEFFIVLEGRVRLQHGQEVVEGTAGSFAYTPRGVSHAFMIDSAEARLLLFFGPAGVERFFREVGTPATTVGPPPADLPPFDREAAIAIMARHGQTVVGPPLPLPG
jgi:quercetin dioxygenase-like cupin family protein